MDELNRILSNFSFVKDPDHPYVYSGPDYLISNDDKLATIYIPQKSEERSVYKLYYRLINSKLAYPSKTIHILLLKPNSKFNQSHKEKKYFDKVIEQKDLKKLKILLKDGLKSQHQRELKNIQQKIFELQAKMETNNLDFIKGNKFEENGISSLAKNLKKEKYYNNFKQKEEIPNTNIYQLEKNILGIKELTSQKSDLYELRPFYEFSIGFSFNIENGIPFFEQKDQKFLNVNKAPVLDKDPNKPIRIASLFGWYLSNIHSIDELDQRVLPNEA